jgi:hypothetical protein
MPRNFYPIVLIILPWATTHVKRHKLGFSAQPMAAKWKMKNGKWKMIVCALRTILNHFRRKYHNFQFSIVNFPLRNTSLN